MAKTNDGVGGEEGTFCLCTLWCVLFSMYLLNQVQKTALALVVMVRCIEALTRAGEVDKSLLPKAVNMFEVCPAERGRALI